MSATVRFGDDEATIDGYEWTGEDSVLVGLLNAGLDPDGPWGSDPAPDYHAALEAAVELDGEVIAYDLPEYVTGRVY